MATNVSELKSDMTDLKSDMDNNSSMTNLKLNLKLDIENTAKNLKLDMSNKIKASHDDLMSHVGTFDVRIKKVEKLTKSVPDLVQTVNTKLSENLTI